MNLTKIDKRTGLPAFLIIPQHVRDEVWRRNPPKPMPLMQLRTGPEVDPAVVVEIKAVKKARSIGKLKAWQREGSVKRDAKGVLRDQNGVPVRWDTARSKFVPEPKFGGAGPVPSPLAAKVQASPAVKASERAPASDDIVQQIKDRCGMDVGKLKKFAKANGVWKDEYAALPNPGLVRMNVINRLRAKIRKGHQVVW